MSNRLARLAISMVYLAVHPTSEEKTGATSEVHERELLEPFRSTEVHGLDNILHLTHLQNLHPRDLVHDVDLENGTKTAKLEDSQIMNLLRLDRPAFATPK